MAGSSSRSNVAWPPTVGGNQPSCTAKNVCAMKQSTKIGTETSSRLTTSALASKNEPLRRPLMRPMVSASTISMMIAIIARVSVTGKVRARMSLTD